LATALVAGAAGTPNAAAAPGDRSCSDLPRTDHTRIVGDLVVDAVGPGQVCRLDHVAVTGDVTVLAGAQLTTQSSAIKGDLRVEADAHVTTTASTVHGGVHLGGELTHLTVVDSTVRRSIRGSGIVAIAGGAHVEGALTVRDGRVQVDRSTIGGWVSTHDTSLAVTWSVLGRGMSAHGGGSVEACGSDIAADVVVDDVTIGDITLGDPGIPERLCDRSLVPDPRDAPTDAVSPTWTSPVDEARTDLRIGGDLVLANNTPSADTQVLEVHVAGDLVCTGNTPTPAVAPPPYVTVAGQRSGQCG
jgi:hypothetical protein